MIGGSLGAGVVGSKKVDGDIRMGFEIMSSSGAEHVSKAVDHAG